MILIKSTRENIYCLGLREDNMVYYERKIYLKEIDRMKKDNRELLESLIQNRLEEALKNEDENSKAFKEAMEAIDRQLEIDRRELEMQKEELKLEHEKEMNEVKQNFEILKDENKQQYEYDMVEKRHECELEKERLKSNLEEQRNCNNRTFQKELEESRRDYELMRDTIAHEREMEKAKTEANQAKLNTAVKAVEILAAVVVAPLIDYRCKETFARMLCEFEKDYNFTTMAGRSLSGLFKFKK